MSLHLVTGYAGEPHITAPNIAAFNKIIFDDYVVTRAPFYGDATSLTNIRITGKDLVWQGRHIVFEGDYQDVTIDAGQAGKWRRDVIVIDYIRDMETGVESVQLEVLKGTESTDGSWGDRPEIIYGDLDTDYHVQVLLFDVFISEQTVSEVQLVSYNIASLAERLQDLIAWDGSDPSSDLGALSDYIRGVIYPAGTVQITTASVNTGWTQIKSEVISGTTYYWWRKDA